MVAARWMMGGVAGASLAALLAVAPATGAPDTRGNKRAAPRLLAGSAFTPSAADTKMAALFARSGVGLETTNFRFTPSQARAGNRAITVAVRSRTNRPAARDAQVAAVASNAGVVGMAPIAYNLGVAVGWKRFAVSGDFAKVDMAVAPGSRQAADVAVSYAGNRWSGQVKAGTDRALAGSNRLIDNGTGYSVDLGGSYSLTRNLDLTAGMRYRSERDRLTRVEDDRRDSQAVYVGTKFRF